MTNPFIDRSEIKSKTPEASNRGFHSIDKGLQISTMANNRRFILFLALMMMISVHLSLGQHWSHGWYPGGKRELDSLQSPEVSEEIKLCSGDECSYVGQPRKTILRDILVDMLVRQLQRKK
ncbi:progonadoliberin-2 isoform X2 [Erpetoichthys calabaricus]|nr:progonadoliberin-2 isoform X2 [Erpetoichthys calabaricus]XP_039615002.1 progonadoliberin-2 isoform X1 [Polypterus senegalus]